MAEYKVVNIKSDGKTKKIVCDHPDGSFPLVAVINYLSLHQNLCIEDNWEQLISEKDLLETIQNLLDSVDGWSPEDNTSWNQESTVLPMLATQIDLDPYLNSIDGLGSSNATAAVLEVFKVLGIPLFHGCLMDPKKASALHGCSYSGILELYTTKPLPGAKATDLEQWSLIREFVETTDKQLNSYGISCIRDNMILNNQKFAILYRNGEFKLLGLHHGIIHILQTEAGDFEDVEFDRLCVWKTLCNVDEDGIALTGNFRAVDDENAKDVLKLYMEGWSYNKSLPQRIRDEQIAKAEQNAKELIRMEELEKEKRAKKAAAASRKKKKCETSNTPVLSNDGTSESAETSEAADTPKAAAETSEPADIPKAAAAAETREVQNADTSEAASTASQSNASKLFHGFLDTSHYCGRSEIPYFVGEVKLMKERNLFELSVDYSHIKDDCEELSVLIRDDIDRSVRKDLEECLVQYLKDKGVENEKAEKAVLKILEARDGYQSFVELAEKNRLKFVDCHQIYQQVITRCASKFGRRMARGFLKVIRNMHFSGYCWNGGWTGNDMKVSNDGRIFLITAKAGHNVSKEGIEADLKNFWDIISPYFSHEVERFDNTGQKITKKAFPTYFEEFKKDCEDIPDPINEQHKLQRFYRYLLSHPAFMNPLSTATVICHMFTICDSLLGVYEYVYAPLQTNTMVEDWIATVRILPRPFQMVFTHFGKSYYQRGYWFLLKYLRNFLEHVLRYTKNQRPVLDLMNNSLMMSHYLPFFVTKLIHYIVMNFDIENRFATAWEHFENSV
ncbi:uncharacterized protein LOC107303419 [Oryza brachyantha]|uniref:uncharacterized protein LOC107303419 n=1 Tax=Oryza brachyantha TaxID=4533 RepID=UPI001ADBA7BE|nr:uncharacterized protein LOC107303419 [Oryza brachyantha]